MPAEILAVEKSKRPRDGRTARETRNRDHAVPAVVDGLRWRRTGLVRREVLAREDASECADVVGDRRGKLALIQHLRTAACDRFERTREIGLD